MKRVMAVYMSFYLLLMKRSGLSMLGKILVAGSRIWRSRIPIFIFLELNFLLFTFSKNTRIYQSLCIFIFSKLDSFIIWKWKLEQFLLIQVSFALSNFFRLTFWHNHFLFYDLKSALINSMLLRSSRTSGFFILTSPKSATNSAYVYSIYIWLGTLC